MALSLDEIIAGINELASDDKDKAKEVATAIRERAKPVAQVLLNAGSALKKDEVKSEIQRLKDERQQAVDDLEDVRTQLDELKAKTPDAKAIEDRLTATHTKALTKERERAENAERRARELNRQVARDIVHSHLVKPNEAGVYVEPEYAELVLGKYEDRLSDKDDGSLDVLQIDDAVPYDGKDLKEKAAALARDIRKSIQPRYLITSADSGAGVRGGNGGGSTAGKTVEQIKQEKLSNPAFSGL